MKPLTLKGCGTALFTPFRDGKVDEAAFAATVRRQVEAGIHFLVPLGTSGETPCLSVAERQRVLALTRENAPGKTLLVGGGTNSLTATLESMAQLPDADARCRCLPHRRPLLQQAQPDGPVRVLQGRGRQYRQTHRHL